ncbi:MAG: hypothetical protein A2542_00155 [Parcubacteria group bacterium RIFOXYD2_FULL_52_8]|nr:MAG: hypothetical protein A2542_00155 [Parcubacteria group bacterium RIFOXYD2_FULL_52_8]
MTKISELKTLLDWAYYYRSIGWSVFPVGSDKMPLIKWTEYQKRRATDKELNEWFSISDTKSIGVVTGVISGLLALDLDIYKGADISGLALPPTAVSKTGGGGWHHFYKYPKDKVIRNSAGIIGSHIDIRGEGGYVVAPPSLHASGNYYAWAEGASPDEIEIAEIPQWLEIKLSSNSTRKQRFEEIVKGVKTGSRNESAAALIGRTLRACPMQEWESVCWPLIEGWNSNNQPPLPHIELRSTFDSIKSAELRSVLDPIHQTPILFPVSYLGAVNSANA